MRARALARCAGVALLGAGIAWAFLHRESADAAALETWLDRRGPWAPVAFVAAYALFALFFVPGSALTLAAGGVFGPVAGTFLSLAGATAGAILAFLFSRYVSAGWVARRAGDRLGRLIRGVESEGWRFVAFVRLVPLFPYNLLNYALGLTRISFWQYAAATAVCMLPGAAAYAYLGHTGRKALTGSEGLLRAALLALALLATAWFVLPLLAKRLRRREAPSSTNRSS